MTGPAGPAAPAVQAVPAVSVRGLGHAYPDGTRSPGATARSTPSSARVPSG